MSNEIIISDSLQLTLTSPNIYQVSGLVMQPQDRRENAVYVSVTWNSNAGMSVLKAQLQAAYEAIMTDPYAALKASIISQICTDVPIQDQSISLENYTINCNSVTVNSKT
jgi:hypothetical protein